MEGAGAWGLTLGGHHLPGQRNGLSSVAWVSGGATSLSPSVGRSGVGTGEGTGIGLSLRGELKDSSTLFTPKPRSAGGWCSP